MEVAYYVLEFKIEEKKGTILYHNDSLYLLFMGNCNCVPQKREIPTTPNIKNKENVRIHNSRQPTIKT